MWHDAFICVLSLFHIRCMTRQYVYCMHTHDSFIYVAWRIHMCDITFHDSFISRPKVTPSREKRHHTHQWVVFSDITLMKRDLHWSKETHIHAKRPTLLKRDLSWRIHMCDITLIEMNPSPPGGVPFCVCSISNTGRKKNPRTHNTKFQKSVQPIAFGVSFLQFQVSIDVLVL